MSSCEDIFDCPGSQFCCNSVCVSFETCKQNNELTFATIAGIAFGSFFFIVIVIICVYCYFFKKAGSARGIGFFGSTGTTTVVTRGPVTTQNTGAANFQTNVPSYPATTAPGGPTTMYPQTNIGQQPPPPVGPVMPQYAYGAPPPPAPETFPLNSQISTQAADQLPPSAPPPYEASSNPYYNQPPIKTDT